MQMDTIAGGSSEPDLNGAKLGGGVEIETLYGGVDAGLYGSGNASGGGIEPDLNGAKLGTGVEIETLYGGGSVSGGGIEPDLYGGGSLDAIF
jgi:hypothetical protein